MVTIRSPWAFQDLVHELDRMTRDAGWAFGGSSLSSDSRTTGLRIQEDNAFLEVDLPGVKDEDLTIELEDNRLTIQARRSDLHEENEEVILRERTYGEFSRAYSLPWPVQQDSIDARFESGVLSLHFNRAPEAAPRRIEVKSS